jgi:phosphatidylserine/phosphatidylglycerophosphate/cardiolipin synthase-like enzyme
MTRFAIALISLAACCASNAETIAVPPTASNAAVEVFFSPGAHVEQALAGAILSARKRVWLAGYTFTSAPIAKALHEARERKVDVRIVLDQSQATAKYSSATYFHNQGVPVRINGRYPIMHHKFMVIDEDRVGFGSMNFTKAGTKDNAENFNLFRRWPKLTEAYAQEFQRLERESEKYQPPAPDAAASATAEGKAE